MANMSRFVLAMLLCCVSYYAAQAAFAIFQTSKSAQATLTCSITSGTCTGANPFTFTAATCNGTADDAPAFVSFNNAVITWQATNSGQIELDLPGGGANCRVQGALKTCNFVSLTRCPFINIKNLKVVGQGPAQTSLSFDSGTLISLMGLGIHQDNAHSARTATVSAGSSCVMLLTTAQTSLFTVGQPARMSGVNTQQIWSAPFGFPDNPEFFQYLTVQSINAGTGQICFTEMLTHEYKSTWPNYNQGDAFEVDGAGPATLSVIDPSWMATVEFDNMTISFPEGQIYAQGKSITYKNVAFVGSCPIPTQNGTWTIDTFSITGCNILEVDKVNDAMVFANGTLGELQVQSATTKVLQMNNVTADQLQGTPATTIGANNTFTTTTKVGATSFGASASFQCQNCTLNNTLGPGGILDTGGSCGVQNVYVMSGGVLKSPNGTAIASIQKTTNPSFPGQAQLVVSSSAGWQSGQCINLGQAIASAYSTVAAQTVNVDDSTHMTLTQAGQTFPDIASLSWSGGTVTVTTTGNTNLPVLNGGGQPISYFATISGASPSGYNGSVVITMVDSTHFTYPLVSNPGTATSVGAYTLQIGGVVSRGDAQGGYSAVPWGIPGANILFRGSLGIEAICQIADLTQDATFTYITFSGASSVCSGGFPTDVTEIDSHPAPSLDITGSTGAGVPPANLPMFSWASAPCPGTIGTGGGGSAFGVYGALSTLEINVTVPSSTAAQMHVSRFDNWSVYVNGVPTTGYGPFVAAAVSGDRVIHSNGSATCNGSAGACAGDNLSTPSGLWFGQSAFSGCAYNTVPDPTTAVTVTVQTDQGVVPGPNP